MENKKLAAVLGTSVLVLLLITVFKLNDHIGKSQLASVFIGTGDFPNQVINTTNTQAVLNYTAPDTNPCTIAVSENSNLTPLVHDVDPSLFTGANLDNRNTALSNGTTRIFVIGKRVNEKATDGKTYSRALQAYTTHYYKITCGAKIGTGSFSTANIPLGNSFNEVPQVDTAGKPIEPTFSTTDRTQTVIDPQTGALVKRVSLPSDKPGTFPYLDSGGGTRMCGFQTVGPNAGYLCSFPGIGGGPGMVYYIIPSTGEVRFLGNLWLASGLGPDWPAGGTTAVGYPKFDPADPKVIYYQVLDNEGHNIAIKGTYTGDFSAVPGNTTASFTWVGFTPEPNHLGQLIHNYDSSFDPTKFNCGFQVGGQYAQITCLRGIQDSYGWVAIMDMGNRLPLGSCGTDPNACPHVIAATNMMKNPQSRWCGLHAANLVPNTPLDVIDLHGLEQPQGVGTGPYATTLSQSISSSATTITVSGQPMEPSNDPYVMDAAVGDAFIIDGEIVKITSLITPTQWVVQRGFRNSTPQSHTSGATTTAECSNGNDGYWHSLYWKFLNTPNGLDPANMIAENYLWGGHITIASNYRIQEAYSAVAGPLMSNLNVPISFNVDSSPLFAGAKGWSYGSAYSRHPSYQQYNAPANEQNWFLDQVPFDGGNFFVSDSGNQLISGQLYKYNLQNNFGGTPIPLNRKQLTTVASSGGYGLTDISGPGSFLSDTSADSYKYCIANAPGECRPSSQIGDIFVNAPGVQALTCHGSDDPNPFFLDMCIGNLGAQGQSLYQFGLIANQQGEPAGNSSTLYGAGYSRKLGGAFVGVKGSDLTFKPIPDGTWAFFVSYGFMQDVASAPGLLMLKVPPFVKDNIDRTTFVRAPLTLTPPSGQGIVSAKVYFGYSEQGSPDQYYCTSRRESCVAVSATVNDANPFYFATTDNYTAAPCSTSCTITLPVLPAHTAYFKVSYLNASGLEVAADQGVASEMAAASLGGISQNSQPPPLDTTPPSIPSGLSASALSASSISLSWSPSTDDTGVAGYNVYRGSVKIATINTTSYTDTGLSASTQYTYTVSAFDAAGNASAQSLPVSATTLSALDTTAPSTPINLSDTPVSTSEIDLGWSASTDNVAVAGYKVYRKDSANIQAQIAQTNNPSYKDTALSPQTTYTYNVAAYDAAGNVSTQSTAVTGTTLAPSNGAPVISNILVSNITTNSATISWTTDQPSDSQVLYGLSTAYNISSPTDFNLTTTHQVNLINLSKKSKYHFSVKSTNQNSLTSYSTDLTFQTKNSTKGRFGAAVYEGIVNTLETILNFLHI